MAYWHVLHTDLGGEAAAGTAARTKRMGREDLPFLLSSGASFRDLVTSALFLKGAYSGAASSARARNDGVDHRAAMLEQHKREMLKAGSSKAGIDWFFNGEPT